MSIPFKTIICPTDFSETAAQAVQVACEWADRFEAHLHLVHVVHEVQRAAVEIHSSAESLAQASEEMDGMASEIASAAQEIARGAESQTAELSRTDERAHELAGIAAHVAAGAHNVNQAASEAARRAHDGSSDAKRAADGILELTVQNAEASKSMEGFREKAAEIGALINSVRSSSDRCCNFLRSSNRRRSCASI